MVKGFPVFSARRFQMRPTPARAYLFTREGLRRAVQVARDEAPVGSKGDALNIQLALPHTCFVIEHDNLAVHVLDERSDDDRGRKNHEIKIRVYSRRSRTARYDFSDLTRLAESASGWSTVSQEFREMPGYDVLRRAIYMIAALGALTRVQNGDVEDPGGLLDDPREPDPDRPVMALRRGDTLKYERAPIRRAPQARDVQAEALIRRREHEVRGHWRRLRSGARVWVRAHARGDPELGRVETHYVVE